MEDRRLLSVAATTVGIGAPVLAVFNDPTATAATTFSAQSTNPDVTATVLHTSEELKMKVHTVNADGTTGATGEMDFLLLDDYAPETTFGAHHFVGELGFLQRANVQSKLQ